VVLTIANTNRAPIFVPIAPLLGMEAQPLSFFVQAGDLDGDALSYAAASDLPAGATLRSAHAAFSPGRLAYDQSGQHVVRFSVRDGAGPHRHHRGHDGRAQRQSRARAAGARRSTSGSPATAYTLTLGGSDPDAGTILTYTAQDLPAGATFDHRGPALLHVDAPQ